MSKRYEIFEKIVKAGDSKIFKEWHAEAGITQEDFLDGLKWLCDDPGLEEDENGKRFKPLERELGCHYKRGLVRLKRITDRRRGTHFVEAETGEPWTPTWRTLEDGNTMRNTAASISAEDRI